jgi:hypothetical protein
VRGPAKAAPVGRGVGDSWEDTPVGMALVRARCGRAPVKWPTGARDAAVNAGLGREWSSWPQIAGMAGARRRRGLAGWWSCRGTAGAAQRWDLVKAAPDGWGQETVRGVGHWQVGQEWGAAHTPATGPGR